MSDTFTSPYDLDLALTAYADALENKCRKINPKYDYRVSVTFERGSKFLRVVMSDGFHGHSLGSRRAYAFIAATNTDKFKVGDILKAASWKAPAKNFSRGNVFKPSSYDNHSVYGL